MVYMFRRLCGKVNCNRSPHVPKSKINFVENYLRKFNSNSIKVGVERGFSPGRKIITITFYINGNKAGNAAVNLGNSSAKFNWGETSNKYRGQQVGRILRALITKAVINVGKYNKITHNGSNMGNRSKMRKNGDPRPTSTWILQEQLGFRPNIVIPITKSEFRLGNNMTKINKTLNNYKKGLIGPRRR